VDVNGAYEDVLVNLAPHIMDIDKRDITAQLTLENNYVEVKVPINMHAMIPVRQNYKGTAAAGYEITSIVRSVDYIEVVGAPFDIGEADYITLPDLDISGLTSTRTFSFDVRPELIDTSLSVVNGTPNEVAVTVAVEKQIKADVTYQTRHIRVVGKGNNVGEVIMPAEDVIVTVRGLAVKLNGFDEGKILEAVVDVTGLGVGTHEVGVLFTMPQGVYVDGDVPVITVRLTDGNVSRTPDEPLE
jgi:YbbR domain-containing protein